jgi:hypothetical protein
MSKKEEPDAVATPSNTVTDFHVEVKLYPPTLEEINSYAKELSTGHKD